jgi:uncharacterized membrane protein (UPF0127 family)
MQREIKRVKIADSIWKKALGVMFWKSWGDNQGLLLTQTSGVHTFFVRFPIDLVFLNNDFEIVRLVKNLKPWKISPIDFRSAHVLELTTGTISTFNLAVGDKIILK